MQPFVVDSPLRRALGDPDTMTGLSLEVQDTFCLYGEETLARIIGLDCLEFDALPADLRARLVRHQVSEGRRLVPSLRSVPTAWRT